MMRAPLLAYALMQLYVLLFQIEQACASSISVRNNIVTNNNLAVRPAWRLGVHFCWACCMIVYLCLVHMKDDLYYFEIIPSTLLASPESLSSRPCQAQTALAQRFPNLVTAGRIAGRDFCCVAASVLYFLGLDLRYHASQEVLHVSIGAQSASQSRL
jgi:hypothetical protein